MQNDVEKVNCERCGGCGILDQWGFAMDNCSLCNPTVDTSLSVEPVSNRYKLDFDDESSIRDGSGNSIIALGYIVACLSRGMADEDIMYRVAAIDAPNAQATIENARTGNQYCITIKQISGEE